MILEIPQLKDLNTPSTQYRHFEVQNLSKHIRQMASLNIQRSLKQQSSSQQQPANPGEKQPGKLGTRELAIQYYSQVPRVDTSHSSDSSPGRWSHLFQQESEHITFVNASSLEKLAITTQHAGTTLPNAP